MCLKQLKQLFYFPSLILRKTNISCETKISCTSFPRFEHLDSVRGIAALVVAFYHSLRPFAEIPRGDGIISVLNGHTAVLFFFILSGFVLSGSLNARGGVILDLY